MPRKPASDSIAGKTAAKAAEKVEFCVPEGLPALTKPEKTAWDQYIAFKNGWKSAELRGLHRIVKLETELKRAKAEAKRAPLVYEKINGDLTEHPIHPIVRNTQKLIHSELRVLGLNSTVEGARKHAGEGQQAPDASKGRGKAGGLRLLR